MSFKNFLQPRSIAVIGGREADEVVRQCIKAGFSGEIWPIHPKKEFVEGKKVYRSISDLPSAPDAAYVAVNRNLSVSIIQQLADIGAGGAICYASGFSESGEAGKALEKQLLEASGDMPLLGPNCYGMLNYLDQAPLWPDQHGGVAVESGVAIITQSSNVAVNFTMQQRSLPVAYLVSLGNQVKFTLPDAIKEYASQDRVTAIGLYLESIPDPAVFEQAILFAKSLGKPVVAIKSGRSDVAKSIAMSHTASLAGSDDLINALFKRCGVGRVKSMEGLLEALKVLHVHGPLNGYDIGAMSPSGGDGALVADALEDLPLQLGQLSDQHKTNIQQTVHDLVGVSNPFDYQLFDWDNEERLTDTFSAFLNSQFDLSLCLFDYPRLDRCDSCSWMPAQNALIHAVKNSAAKTAVLSMLPEGMPEETAKLLMAEGIVPLAGLAASLEGVSAAADIGNTWKLATKEPISKLRQQTVNTAITLLDEAESKQLLKTYGLTIPNNRIVSNAQEAKQLAVELGFPLVAKALGVAHKTDVGGVKLNLNSDKEVADAITSMADLSDRFLIEAMVDDVVAELIVGVFRDPQFGPYLVIGAGGILVELMKDSQSLLFPVTREDVTEAITGLRSAPLLTGFRGRAKADIEAAVDAVMSVATFAQENIDKIEELDINPLLIRTSGAVAADALLRMAD